MKRSLNIIRHSGMYDVREVSASREIVGVITTNGIDRYREIVEPDGVILDAYRKNPVVLLNHMSYDLPIGSNVWIRPEKNGLIAKTRFADTMIAEDVLQMYREKIMSAWSIGFIAKEWIDADGSEEWRRKYTKWELLEYSAVTVPANPEALSNAISIARSAEVRDAIEHQMEIMRLVGVMDDIMQQQTDLRAALEAMKKEFHSRIDSLFIDKTIGMIDEIIEEEIDAEVQPPQKIISEKTSREISEQRMVELASAVISEKLRGKK